jgi:hypothetical protein
MFDEVTLLIQGPITDNTYSFVSKYTQVSKHVVFSTWATDDQALVSQFRALPITVLFNDLPDLTLVKKWQPDQAANYYYQTYSTCEGLKETKTKYVIKLRSDEHYNNLNPIVEELLKDDTKLISSNILTTPPTISDHLFCGKTKSILEAFLLLVTELNSDKKPKTIKTGRGVSIETTFTNMLLKKLEGVKFVSFKKLGEFSIKANGLKLTYTHNTKTYPIEYFGKIK